MFDSTGPHYCPECPEQWSTGKFKRRINHPLELITRNYSGYGVDVVQCPVCRRIFQISYRVDKILDVTEELKNLNEEDRL